MPQTITYKNNSISVNVSGSGEPIIFLHGWPNNSLLWKTQVEALQNSHKAITFDWLGFGKSDKPKGHVYTFTAMKENLDAVIQQTVGADEKINIVAHDIGGPAGILWAAENPLRVKRLILLNTVIYPFSTPLDAVSHFAFRIPILKNIQMSNFGLKTTFKVLSKSSSRTMSSRIDEILETPQNLDADMKVRLILEPLKHGKQNEFKTLASTYKSLDIEKHLIIAKNDPLLYAHISKLSKENPEVPVHQIGNSGHFIPLDQPMRLNLILSSILNTD
ncbi:MAG: alpha/beta hydrolase [Calditrichota bacterium]